MRSLNLIKGILLFATLILSKIYLIYLFTEIGEKIYNNELF